MFQKDRKVVPTLAKQHDSRKFVQGKRDDVCVNAEFISSAPFFFFFLLLMHSEYRLRGGWRYWCGQHAKDAQTKWKQLRSYPSALLLNSRTQGTADQGNILGTNVHKKDGSVQCTETISVVRSTKRINVIDIWWIEPHVYCIVQRKFKFILVLCGPLKQLLTF